jgi:hypothetical protein
VAYAEGSVSQFYLGRAAQAGGAVAQGRRDDEHDRG